MHRRDYLLRLIEQLGSVLAELRRRILGGGAAPADIHTELAAVAGRAGLDLDLLRGFSGETLHMLVSPAGEVEPARCWVMAEVLYLDALQAQLEEREEDAHAGFAKARLLFSMIAPGGGTVVGLPESAGRLEEIDARLAELG